MRADRTVSERSVEIDHDEQMIVDRVYSAVLERRLAPRTKLSEAALCESFGVGRMRVRRALLLLASQGIVDLQSNRGAYVACPSPSDAQEVFEARAMIEPALARALAGTASPDTTRRLQAHIERENAARRLQERGEIIRLSGEFHVELASEYGNAVLTRAIRELVTRTSLIVGLFGTDRGSTCPENEHAEIVAAIAKGDGDRAEALAREHLNHIQSGLDLARKETERPDIVKILGEP